MHVLNDPDLSPRVRALLARARRYPTMDASLIKEQTSAVDAEGTEKPTSPEALDAMLRFEER
jgi:hypothetical protein